METPKKTRRAEDYMILMMPSVSGKWDVWTSIAISQLPFLLQKQFLPMVERGKSGVARARTYMLEGIKNFLDQNGIEHGPTIRALMFDDDLILDFNSAAAKEMARYIFEADKNHWNIIANYQGILQKGVGNCIFHDDGASLRPYSDDEIEVLREFDPLPNTVAGLGFYYGDVPLDYKFYDDSVGEDMHFFRDNKLDLRYVPLTLWHEKREYMGFVPQWKRDALAGAKP